MRSYVLYKMSDQNFENERVLEDGKDIQKQDSLGVDRDWLEKRDKERTTNYFVREVGVRC